MNLKVYLKKDKMIAEINLNNTKTILDLKSKGFIEMNETEIINYINNREKQKKYKENNFNV